MLITQKVNFSKWRYVVPRRHKVESEGPSHQIVAKFGDD
jgi:hypothetical protein